LTQAIRLNPEHLSWYQLTVEPNTVFHSKPPILPLEDELDGIQRRGESLLAQAGYGRYEVSAFSKANRESRHNINYWLFGDYLGIGAGAHGKYTLSGSGKIVRTRKAKQPKAYLANQSAVESRPIAQDELGLEFLMNGLRLRTGFTPGEFESRTGLPFTSVSNTVDSLIERGLLRSIEHGGESRVAASDRGYRFLNSVLGEFL
jgi:oxygen-independent coproporphyrinogen-3 oxidase